MLLTHATPKTQRLLRQLKVIIVVVTAIVAYRAWRHYSHTTNELRPEQPAATTVGGTLQVTRVYTVPLQEVSGMAIAPELGAISLVGDHEAALVVLTLNGLNEIGGIRHFDLSHTLNRPGDLLVEPADQKDFEALALDGRGQYYLLQEAKARLLVLNPSLDQLVATIDLAHEFTGKKHANNLFEGLVLLRDGHVLVVKEKKPPLILEYGPKQHQPAGYHAGLKVPAGKGFSFVGPHTTLQQLGRWQLPTDSPYRDCDFSDLFAAADGKLYVLSDECRGILVLPGLQPEVATMSVAGFWALPQDVKHPEALGVWPGVGFLVGSDTKKAKKNLFLLQRYNKGPE